MNFYFRAYELLFESAFPGPGCHQSFTPEVHPDVRITLGKVPLTLENATIASNYYQLSSRELLLTIPGVARYLVSHGSSIVVEPFPEADADKVCLFLFGSALGGLLYQRALFPLHGSAVVSRYGAMIFVGAQGIGKSTLAAHFRRRGYSLLSDDVCAIRFAGDFQVLPAFPQMRLCDDALERLGDSSNGYTESARFDVDKYVLSLEGSYSQTPLRLCAVYLLTDHQEPSHAFMPVSGFNRVRLLFENLYRPAYLQGLDSMGEVMQMATRFAQDVTICEIRRFRDFDRIDDLIDRLELEWEGIYSLGKGGFRSMPEQRCH